MGKYLWKATIKDGCIDEYIRRRDYLPSDMKSLLREARICNYTIWNAGNKLFGYYECRNGVDCAAKVQSESEVIKHWDVYMSDILIMDKDPFTGAQPLLRQVFFLDRDSSRPAPHWGAGFIPYRQHSRKNPFTFPVHYDMM